MSLGREDERRLLQHRRLVLLVDLDQTLIHTTNEDIQPNLKNVHHFQVTNNLLRMGVVFPIASSSFPDIRRLLCQRHAMAGFFWTFRKKLKAKKTQAEKNLSKIVKKLPANKNSIFCQVNSVFFIHKAHDLIDFALQLVRTEVFS